MELSECGTPSSGPRTICPNDRTAGWIVYRVSSIMRRMWSFPKEWEELLWTAVRQELPSGAVDPRALTAAIMARTHRYTDQREHLSEPLTGAAADRDLAARALFFTVADAAKVAIPLAELRARRVLPMPRVRVLDVGAGIGAMTFGLLAAEPGLEYHVTVVDRDERALAILRRVVGMLPRPPGLEVLRADATRALPAGPFDLILVGTALNELSPAARLPLVEALLERLSTSGALILIEPALRETSRALHELRDEIVRTQRATVFAPCTRSAACPALLDPRDWCHEDRPFASPPKLAALMQRTGLRTGGLKFAYLTLRKEPERLATAAPPARVLRVVSAPLDQKGTIERIVCGDDGRYRLRLLRRNRTEMNRDLGVARRGDVLIASGEDVGLRVSRMDLATNDSNAEIESTS